MNTSTKFYSNWIATTHNKQSLSHTLIYNKMTHQYIRSTNQIFTNKKAPNRLRKNHKCINQVVTQQLQGIKDTYKIEIGSATKLVLFIEQLVIFFILLILQRNHMWILKKNFIKKFSHNIIKIQMNYYFQTQIKLLSQYFCLCLLY